PHLKDNPFAKRRPKLRKHHRRCRPTGRRRTYHASAFRLPFAVRSWRSVDYAQHDIQQGSPQWHLAPASGQRRRSPACWRDSASELIITTMVVILDDARVAAIYSDRSYRFD
ncbi:hypothetical protein, partial [Mesorhizobium sp.]|uniref:hypothetical protein n=1 Tax=Mesorhizobium sp. TaxID=1871066 RepID=UPI0025DCE9E3